MTRRQMQALANKLSRRHGVRKVEVVEVPGSGAWYMCGISGSPIHSVCGADGFDEQRILHEFSHHLQHVRFGCPFERKMDDHGEEFQEILREVLIAHYGESWKKKYICIEYARVVRGLKLSSRIPVHVCPTCGATLRGMLQMALHLEKTGHTGYERLP